MPRTVEETLLLISAFTAVIANLLHHEGTATIFSLIVATFLLYRLSWGKDKIKKRK